MRAVNGTLSVVALYFSQTSCKMLSSVSFSLSIVLQENIINAGILPALLSFICNGSYETNVLGRESARILANLSDRLAARVIAVVGEKSLKSWMDSVDGIDDVFVKQQAVRARGALSSLFETESNAARFKDTVMA